MAIQEIQYKVFSLKTHKKNLRMQQPSICQFELTHKCGLHCRHCYSDCYNKPSFTSKELSTQEVKSILDKVYQAGAIWLCFTGGDPLTRKDFLDIYAYAKKKGFVIMIFTNAYSMTREIISYLKSHPPFVIEVTLNAVTQELYEKISQVKGSCIKAMQGIDLILKAKLPLKIKTQVIKDNVKELPQIKKFISSLGLKFQPSILLHPRLNGDTAPCRLRVSIQKYLASTETRHLQHNDCRFPAMNKQFNYSDKLFRCAAPGADGFILDPYGNIFLCNLIRSHKIKLLSKNNDIKKELYNLAVGMREKKFSTRSKCRFCQIQQFCYNCPGKAYLEVKNEAGRVRYLCRFAHDFYRQINRKRKA